MFNNKNLTALVASALIIVSSNIAFAYTPIGQDYHTPPTKGEIEDLDNYISEVYKQHNNDIKKSSFLENKIKALIVRYNSDKLKTTQNKYDDGLKDVFIANTKNPTDLENNGEQFTGYIYITQGYINGVTSKYSGNFNANLNDYNIYGLSAIASVYAHESAHWYYDDSWINEDQEDNVYKREVRADKLALKIVNNVPSFSVGGGMISESRSASAGDGWNSNTSTHPSHNARWNIAYEYIQSESDYRIFFEDNKPENNHLIVGNSSKTEYYTVYPPNQYNPDTIIDETTKEDKSLLMNATDRAYYVSGQIAWAINHNAWDSRHVKYVDAHKYFNDFPADVKATAIIVETNNTYKIIDWYFANEYLTQNQQAQLNKYLTNLKASYQ